MPLDIANAQEATPTEITDLVASDEKSTLDVQSARSVAPPYLRNMSVTPMTEAAAAGVSLAKTVLGIMTGTLIGLLLYLTLMDVLTGRDIAAVYGNIINPNKIGSEIYTLSAFDRMITDLSEIRTGKTDAMTAAMSSNINAVVSIVDRLHSVPLEEKNTVKGCSVIPPDDTKEAITKKCLETLNGIRQAAIDASSGIADAQIAAEYAGKVIEERGALHSF